MRSGMIDGFDNAFGCFFFRLLPAYAFKVLLCFVRQLDAFYFVLLFGGRKFRLSAIYHHRIPCFEAPDGILPDSISDSFPFACN